MLYFLDLIEVMRMIMLKGSGFKNIAPQLGCIALFALVFNNLAIYIIKNQLAGK